MQYSTLSHIFVSLVTWNHCISAVIIFMYTWIKWHSNFLVIDGCEAETDSEYGIEWPATAPNNNVQQDCGGPDVIGKWISCFVV